MVVPMNALLPRLKIGELALTMSLKRDADTSELRVSSRMEL